MVSLKPVCHGSEVLEAMQAQREGWIRNGNVHTHTYRYIFVYLKTYPTAHKDLSHIKGTDE